MDVNHKAFFFSVVFLCFVSWLCTSPSFAIKDSRKNSYIFRNMNNTIYGTVLKSFLSRDN